MNQQTIGQMKRDQYQDELLHKMETYDRIKATLELCNTMIKALDTTSDNEKHSKGQLVGFLEMAQTYAMLAAIDVDLERRGAGK